MEYWVVVYLAEGYDFPVAWAGRSKDEAERHACYQGREFLSLLGPFYK